MEGITIWYILVVTGIFFSACSQLLLKIIANKEHSNLVASMLNWHVITSYVISCSSLFINVTAMSKGVKLKDMPVLESIGYVFVPILSFLVLKEKITVWTILSISLIMLGIIIFYI